jgi:hypothetical protein
MAQKPRDSGKSKAGSGKAVTPPRAGGGRAAKPQGQSSWSVRSTSGRRAINDLIKSDEEFEKSIQRLSRKERQDLIADRVKRQREKSDYRMSLRLDPEMKRRAMRCARDGHDRSLSSFVRILLIRAVDEWEQDQNERRHKVGLPPLDADLDD